MRPKQKYVRLDRLEDQLTQSDFYTRYGRKKAKISNGDPDYNLDDANNDSTDNNFNTKDNKQTDPDEYKRLAENFYEDLNINFTSGDDVRNRYNKLMAAKQEN